MPSDWADYPPYHQVAQYFDDFADHFDLRRRITFNTAVEAVVPLDGPGPPGEQGWAVTTSDGQTWTYQDVLVANGHHSSPKIPDFTGEYTGESFHAHDYRDPVFRRASGAGHRCRQLGHGHRLRCGPDRRIGVVVDPARGSRHPQSTPWASPSTNCPRR